MGLREEKKTQQRADLVDAAVGLFRARGFDETRVQDIIDRAHVSEATFFNYFPTKEAVLEEYAIGAIEHYAALLRAEIADESRSVSDRIRELLRIMALGLEAEDRGFMAVVATKSKLFYGGEGTVFEQKVLTQGLLARLFEEGQATGEVRRDIGPEALAESLGGAFTFTIVNWFTGRWEDSGSLQARMAQVAELFLDGCRAKQRKSR